MRVVLPEDHARHDPDAVIGSAIGARLYFEKAARVAALPQAVFERWRAAPGRANELAVRAHAFAVRHAYPDLAGVLQGFSLFWNLRKGAS